MQASPTFGSYEGSHTAFHGALRELGLNFLYFTDRQMRRGEVDLSKFKVIILPMTQAMGGQEAEMLRGYVRNGGVLIADVRPAIYDGHVKPLAAGQLDDVFGVRRTGFAPAVTSDGAIKVPAAGGKLEPLDLVKVRADAGVQATEATAAGSAGQAPLLLSNRFGKGQALLLNLAMASFPALSAEGTPETAAHLLRQALGQGGVSPPLSLTAADGQRLRNVEITRWMNGPVQIVSVFRHQGLPEAAKLDLPQPLYVYDLKARQDLGQQQAVSLTVTPYRAHVLRALPAAAQGGGVEGGAVGVAREPAAGHGDLDPAGGPAGRQGAGEAAGWQRGGLGGRGRRGGQARRCRGRAGGVQRSAGHLDCHRDRVVHGDDGDGALWSAVTCHRFASLCEAYV